MKSTIKLAALAPALLLGGCLSFGGEAPDSLLKLGMSLSRMEKLREACTAFSRFLSKYPKANARLQARIDRERRQARCR